MWKIIVEPKSMKVSQFIVAGRYQKRYFRCPDVILHVQSKGLRSDVCSPLSNRMSRVSVSLKVQNPALTHIHRNQALMTLCKPFHHTNNQTRSHKRIKLNWKTTQVSFGNLFFLFITQYIVYTVGAFKFVTALNALNKFSAILNDQNYYNTRCS
jgi:hypothetical protein